MRRIPYLIVMILIAIQSAGATPVASGTRIDKLDLYSQKDNTSLIQCGRIKGTSAPLTAGMIEGIRFVPLYDELRPLKTRYRKAKGKKKVYLQQKIRSLEMKGKICRNERTLNFIVTDYYECSHRPTYTECHSDGQCRKQELVAGGVEAHTIDEALSNSLSDCQEQLGYLQNAVATVIGPAFGITIQIEPGQECRFFGCGTLPNWASLNVHACDAIGTYSECPADGPCRDKLVTATFNFQPSRELAKAMVLA